MTEYNVTAVAEEMMLDETDLQEIYEVFFAEAQDLLAGCKQSISEQNYTVLARILHNLKGAANNLRMYEIGYLVVEIEKLGAVGNGIQFATYLSELHSKINDIKKSVNNFYSK